VAYILGSGYQGFFTYTTQDVEVAALDGGQAVRVTDSGGAWNPAWSPDGAYVTFSDYDEFGVQQLYRVTADGQDRRQLTALSDPHVWLEELTWSPDGDFLAVTVVNTELGQSTLGLLGLAGEPQLSLLPGLAGVGRHWWQTGHYLVAAALPAGRSGDSTDDFALVWIDAEQLVFSVLLDGRDRPGQAIYNAGPLGPASVGFFSFPDFYRLSLDDSTVTQVMDQQFDVWDWNAGPSTFRGEQHCPP
jgi:dipeptidyl aminopeptidase/acylaminoacyl peptidase